MREEVLPSGGVNLGPRLELPGAIDRINKTGLENASRGCLRSFVAMSKFNLPVGDPNYGTITICS